MEFFVGQIVIPKCGRDKGLPMLVWGFMGQDLLLVDGRRRTIVKPKRKKTKHVQATRTIDANMQRNNLQMNDANVRAFLAQFEKTIPNMGSANTI